MYGVGIVKGCNVRQDYNYKIPEVTSNFPESTHDLNAFGHDRGQRTVLKLRELRP